MEEGVSKLAVYELRKKLKAKEISAQELLTIYQARVSIQFISIFQCVSRPKNRQHIGYFSNREKN